MMNLFFVYDTAFCKADEDDPKDAVVYFFPVQAAESQRYFLCCQLAGVAKFLRNTFSSPSVIGLDQGKFAFLWSGNYLLVLGANSEVHTSVLQDQLSFLCGIFCFYHGSINSVFKECKNNRDDFLAKLELAWSRYVTLSQCFGSVLQLSLNALPLKTYRKSSGIVATANRLLHLCQLSSSVTAGAVFYNSRVLSTQFMPQLTNFLSLLSNSNASAPVGNAFHLIKNLPPDVELKCIFLSPKLISSILKYNHTCVGSRVRVKSTSKSFSPCSFKETVSSGSEADVDSGNCSESFHSHRDDGLDIVPPFAARKSKRFACLKPGKKCTTSCCTGHFRVFERNLLMSRNRCFLGLISDTSHTSKRIKVVETEDSGIHSKNESVPGPNYRPDSTYCAVNVFCNSHAYLSASSFVSGSNLQHTNLASTSDSEFRCSLCTSYSNSTYVNEGSLKKWNSEINLSYSSHYNCVCSFLTLSSCENHHSNTKTVEKRIGTNKVQILKCRSNSDSRCNKSKHSLPSQYSSRRHLSDISVLSDSKRTEASARWLNSSRFYDKDKLLNIENNDLQKCVLYVQRYGGSTLVLLLNKVYDEKVINYLWNCGFTILRELEYNTEKQQIESPYNIEPSFYILLYNHAQKILKEYPHFPSLLLTEKHSRDTIQKIQEGFQTDPHLRMICLLSSNHSIFASHEDHNLVFYLQPETNSRKLDPLLYLHSKATRRLGKYFKIAL